MLETRENRAKRFASRPFRPVALLGLLLSFGPAFAYGETLQAYGARMCAEAGIPLEECSLVSDSEGARQEPEPVRREDTGSGLVKAATLVEHGRRVCEQENVPLEECTALPLAYRGSQAVSPSYLIPPAPLQPVDPALLAAAPSPRTAGRAVGTPGSTAPLPVRSARAVPVRSGDPSIRSFRPAPPPAFRSAPAAAPVPFVPPPQLDTRFLPPPPPPPPDTRFFQPPPADPAFPFVEEPAPFVGPGNPQAFFGARPERFRGEEGFLQDDGFRQDAGFLGEGRTGRCRRAVDFSGPGSNRFITC